MRLKLTDQTTASLALQRGKPEVFAWDTALAGFGFRLRRRPDGRMLRTWVAQFRADGRTRRVTIGDAQRLGALQAREAARKLLARVELGHDPVAEKAAKRQRAARSFRSVVDAYLEAKRLELRPSSFRIARLYLTGSYFRPLHPIGIADITQADVAARLSAITRQHSANTSAAARRQVAAMFRWSMQEGIVQLNPVFGTRPPARPQERERVLAGAELAAVWNAANSDDDFDRVVRLLILTGARREEVGGLRWSELDLETGTWALPAERAKNDHAHTITLPAAALDIIATVPNRGRNHLFGGHPIRGFTSWHRSKVVFDKRLGASVRPWRLHDLRRSVATGMIDISVEPHVVEAVLNHQSGHRSGVAGIYNRSTYAPQIKTALLRWADHVIALAEGRATNVAVLKQRA
jgi:integrase